jgi:D-alanine transaminase
LSRIAYVNGQYVQHSSASIHIEDRGYQFSDAVYEVIMFVAGSPLDLEPHLDRLDNSLAQLAIAQPMLRSALCRVILEVVRRNRLRDGIIYLQVSRGVASRDHAFPAAGVNPALVMTAKRLDFAKIRNLQNTGVSVKTFPEIRWRRPDIKSVSLLGNVLAKEDAKAGGAYEAWFVDDAGLITEGTSTNAWIVSSDDALITRQLDQAILPGITRAVLLSVAAELSLKVIERAFSVKDALTAKEAFLTSSTNFVMPVIRIDEAPIGATGPGEVSTRLVDVYWHYVEKATAADAR